MPPISSLGVRERNASSFEMCFSKSANIYFTYLHKNILKEEGNGDWLKNYE